MDNLEEKLASLEALLFVHGEPLSFKKIQKTLNLEPEDAKSLAAELEKRTAASDRGLNIIADDEKIQLTTKPQFREVLQAFVKEQLTEELTPASLEVLAIITYLGPIARSQIEYQRGVNSAFTLRNLLLRGLIERFPHPEHPQTYLYRPSFELFRHLGVRKKEELPDYEKFRRLLEMRPEQPLPYRQAGELHPNNPNTKI